MKMFYGGVHPREYKFCDPHHVEEAPLPEKVWIPLSQHIGAPAQPTVQKGDKVKKGQCIGVGKGFISAAVHASISGEVKAIERFPHFTGKDHLAIHIQSDGLDEAAYDASTKQSWESLSADEIRTLIQEGGIVGMGGAAFPTHVKVSPPKGKQIDTLIVNGVECEPFITADHALMMRETEQIIEGARAIMKAVGAKQCIIAIEANKPDAVQVMDEDIEPLKNMAVVQLPVRYPQGAEKQLIQAVVAREVPSGGLPLDVGVVVQNVATCFAVWEMLTFRKPLIERIVTVSGNGIDTPKNVKVRVGTLLDDLLPLCGAISDEALRVISGGPMMGIALSRTDLPLTKAMNSILVLREKSIKRLVNSPCIGCGRCVDSCPIKLNPALLGLLAEKGNVDQALDNCLQDCIECGCCAYICPASRPLVQLFKYLKYKAAKKQKKTG